MDLAQRKISLPESSDALKERNNPMLERRENDKDNLLKIVFSFTKGNLDGYQDELQKNENTENN
jgi:hypothetical protein